MTRNCYCACVGHRNGEVLGITLTVATDDLYDFQNANIRTITIPGTDKTFDVTHMAYGRTIDVARTRAMALMPANYGNDVRTRNTDAPEQTPAGTLQFRKRSVKR